LQQHQQRQRTTTLRKHTLLHFIWMGPLWENCVRYNLFDIIKKCLINYN
jgi:hypothetical protein